MALMLPSLCFLLQYVAQVVPVINCTCTLNAGYHMVGVGSITVHSYDCNMNWFTKTQCPYVHNTSKTSTNNAKYKSWMYKTS